MPSIKDITGLVAGLPASEQHIFRRIFSVDSVEGRLKIPPSMASWVKDQFGSIEGVTTQHIIKVTNLVTLESSIYNPLRARRPQDYSRPETGKNYDEPGAESDLFANPLEYTAEDIFGRVDGRYCITAANIAKYEQYHCVVIFKNEAPWDFGCNEVADYVETGWRWAQRVNEFDPSARYCMFLWNCTNRSGASIRHGHAQVIVGRGCHYAKVEHLRRAALAYSEKYGSDYFDDLFTVHRALGLGWQNGETRIMVYLAALKQNEVMILLPRPSLLLGENIYSVLEGFRERLGVKSFNLGIAFPPLGDVAGWEGFPVVARMVDRGDTSDLSSDIGAVEMYGANIVSSDPWETVRALKRSQK